MRHQFGGGMSDWAMTPLAGQGQLTAGAVVTAWNQQTGGTQQLLSTDQDGNNVVDHVTTSVGNGVGDNAQLTGRVPVFYGPVGVTGLWLSANWGARVWVHCNDIPQSVDMNAATLSDGQDQLDIMNAEAGDPFGIAQLDSGGLLKAAQVGPHSLANSGDVVVGTARQGSTLVYDSGSGFWTPNPYPGSWTALALESGVTTSSFAEWRTLSPGVIQLRGSVTTSPSFSNGTTIATIPDGFRPGTAYRHVQVASTYVSNAGHSCRLQLGTDGWLTVGVVTKGGATYSPTTVYLDGAVFDIGYNPAAAGPQGSNPSVDSGGTETQTYVTGYSATWSNSYTSSNYARGGNACHQGQSAADGYGDQRSLIGFDHALIQSDLAGATMVGVRVSMYFSWWWYSDGGTAKIGTHNYTSEPGTWASSHVNARRWSSTNWPRGAWRDIDLPLSVATEFQNGTTTGFALGPANSSNVLYYGYIWGAYASAKPWVRLTYIK